MSNIDSQIARVRRREIRRMLREAGGSRKAVSQLVREFPDITIRQTEKLIEDARAEARRKENDGTDRTRTTHTRGGTVGGTGTTSSTRYGTGGTSI